MDIQHSPFCQPLPGDPGKACGDPPARQIGHTGNRRVFGYAQGQPAGANAQIEAVDQVGPALGHQIGSRHAQIDRPFSRQNGNVAGAQKRELHRHVAAAGKEAAVGAAKCDARLVEQLRGNLRQPPLARQADPQEAFGVVVAHGASPAGFLAAAVRAAFSSSPDMPKRRLSSASTLAKGTSRNASRTSMW